MNCPYCGFELLEGAAFCTRCGAVMPDQTGRNSYGYSGYGGASDTGAFDTGRLSAVPELEMASSEAPARSAQAEPPGVSARPAADPYAGAYRPAVRTVQRQPAAQTPRSVAQTSGEYRPVPQRRETPPPAPRREIAPRTAVYGAPPPQSAEDADCVSIRQYTGNPQFRPLGAWKYFGLSLLYAIPLVGLIFLIVHSFSRRNLVRRSFARSHFCTMLVCGCILAAAAAALLFTGVLGGEKLTALWNSVAEAFGQISLPE